MSFHPIDILPIALLGLFLYKTQMMPKGAGLNEDYLSIPTSKSLRGVLAMVIVFHHLAQRTGVGMLFIPFKRFGFLAVSVFFFLSGFGLQKSYIKSEQYKKRFLLRRIPQVLFPYIIVTALFWLLYAADGHIYSFKDIIFSIVKGDPIVSFSWYIINILIFYIAYWLLMLLFGKRYHLMILGAALWYGAYAFFCYKMGYTAYWYSSSHLLVVGMIWATYEDKILAFIKKRYILTTAVSLVSFLALFILNTYFSKAIPFKAGPFLLTMIISVLFVLCVILYSLRFRFGNRILEMLGDCSLEIYLIQGLFIVGLRGNNVYIEDNFLFAILTVAGSVLLGFVLHIAFSKLLKGYRRLVKIG